MSDDTLIGFQPAQEDGTTSEPIQTDQQDGGQPEYVTPAMLDQKLEERLNALTAKLSQSLPDKAVSMMEKRLDKWKAGLEQQGVRVTPEMEAQGRHELAMAELRRLEDEDEEGANPAPQSSPSPFTPEAKAKVQARIAQLQADYGVKLERDEDAWQRLPWIHPNPDVLLEAYEEQLKVKKAKATGGTLPPNPARSPLPAGGAPAKDNAIADINDPGELISLGLNNMRKK